MRIYYSANLNAVTLDTSSLASSNPRCVYVLRVTLYSTILTELTNALYNRNKHKKNWNLAKMTQYKIRSRFSWEMLDNLILELMRRLRNGFVSFVMRRRLPRLRALMTSCGCWSWTRRRLLCPIMWPTSSKSSFVFRRFWTCTPWRWAELRLLTRKPTKNIAASLPTSPTLSRRWRQRLRQKTCCWLLRKHQRLQMKLRLTEQQLIDAQREAEINLERSLAQLRADHAKELSFQERDFEHLKTG